MRKTPLDQLLRTWADAHRATSETHDDLTRRVTTQVRRQPLMCLPQRSAARRASAWLRPLACALAGAAVTLVSLLYWRGPPIGPPTSAPASSVPGLPLAVRQLPPDGPGGLARTVNELFCDRLLWLVETDTDVKLGLATNGHPAELTTSSMVVVRMLVLSKAPSDTEWRRAWEANVVTRPEQIVDTILDGESQSRLALWAYAMEDGAIAVDSKLKLHEPVSVSVDTSRVFISGKPARVFSMQTETEEFQVYQTAALVPVPGGDGEGS